MKTNIYHIIYTPETKEVGLFFWGCNFHCRGCYCERQIYSPMLNFDAVLKGKPAAHALPPESFLTLAEVEKVLTNLEFHSVVLEGQEAGQDPAYLQFTEILHRRFDAKVTLLTNASELPDLSHTDAVVVGIKALDDRLHREYTGVSNRNTLENFGKLVAMKKTVLVNTVLIPGYIDAIEIEHIAGYVAECDPNIPFILLPYFQSGDNPWRRPTFEEMDEAAVRAKKYLNRVFRFRGDEVLKHPLYNVFPPHAQPYDVSDLDASKWLTQVIRLEPSTGVIIDSSPLD